MTCFELNEQLKDILCLEYGAFFAKTLWFPQGVLLMKDPFYETTALWPKDFSLEELKKCYKPIKSFERKINKIGEMTDVLFEYNNGHPSLVWAVFIDKE